MPAFAAAYQPKPGGSFPVPPVTLPETAEIFTTLAPGPGLAARKASVTFCTLPSAASTAWPKSRLVPIAAGPALFTSSAGVPSCSVVACPVDGALGTVGVDIPGRHRQPLLSREDGCGLADTAACAGDDRHRPGRVHPS